MVVLNMSPVTKADVMKCINSYLGSNYPNPHVYSSIDDKKEQLLPHEDQLSRSDTDFLDSNQELVIDNRILLIL